MGFYQRCQMHFDRWDIVEAYYWYLSDYHEGQGSKNYARLCKLEDIYRPGFTTSASGPSNENSRAIYDALVAKSSK